MKSVLLLAVIPALRWMALQAPEHAALYDNRAAAAMLLAIADTESGCRCRDQDDPAHRPGPAYSWWQIEQPTFRDLTSRDEELRHFLDLLGLWPAIADDHQLLAGSEIGAAVTARRLLYRRISRPLPPFDAQAVEEATAQYYEAWRPGKFRPDAFKRAWPRAVQLVHDLWPAAAS